MAMRREVVKLWVLAWPVFLVHLVNIATAAIDTIMVGRASTDELAYLALGRSLYWMVLVVSIGLLSGLSVLTAQRVGAGLIATTGALWRQAIVYALVLAAGGVGFLLLLVGPALAAQGLPPALVEGGRVYAAVTALGLPFLLLVMVSFQYLEGLSRPRPGMAIMLSILPVNIALNWLLIDGHLGAPALGAAGAALATALAQMLAAAAALTYIAKLPDRAALGLVGGWRGAWKHGRALRRFGIAPGVATGLEFAGFGGLSLMSGQFGPVAIAALQAVMMLHMLSFAAVMGFASAVAVRVGNAHGANDRAAIHRAVVTGAWLAGLGMAGFSLLYLSAPMWVLAPFSGDAAVLRLAAGLLMLLAPFLAFDAVQFVLLYALRAMGDQWAASGLQITATFLVMTLTALIAGFGFGLGAYGLIIGLATALVTASLLLSLRYRQLSRASSRSRSTTSPNIA